MRNIQNLQLEDYIDILKRRLVWVLVPGVLVWLVTFFYVRRLPNVYVSETVILVEPPKVPSEYVKSTAVGTVQSRLSTISQQIMSRTRLEKIILDHSLYVERRKTAPMEEVVEGMRRDIELLVNKSDAFTLSYRAQDQALAQKVASQIASLYIEENLKARSEQTEGVTQFLDTQLKQTEGKLKELEDRMSNFKIHNLGALPEQQSANLSTLSRLQMQLQAAIDSVNRLEEKKIYLQRMNSEFAALTKFRVASTPSQPSSVAEVPAVSGYGDLERKKTERDALHRRYTSQHPDVRKLEAEIAILEKRFSESKDAVSRGAASSPPEPEGDDSDYVLAKAEMQSQFDVLEKQIQQGRQEQEKIKKEMLLYQSRVDLVPRIEQMQKEISRDYDTTRQHYQSLLGKRNDAAMATNLEQRQKGEQFRILDPASLPEKPAEPNRLRLNLMGLAIGLAFGAALSLILELKDSSVRSESELALLTKLPVLISVPFIGEPAPPEPGTRSSEHFLKTFWKRLGLSHSLSTPD
ncbi:MAG: Wzz/FepE/Etk N-terminal domain-containing protein [Acidobacteria bacterium]|nr:Wzz/FepE/Etk N-terminal domain-containing protein [Acidobacteriota bacterium]MCI0718371.1 Wzz/FepE/Etk N-terminal domain-containing protein [Acidobacteriota bacterium]